MTYLGWRRQQGQIRQARQWEDAEVLADVRRLLQDIDPIRRRANVNRAPGAEDALWSSPNQRRDEVRRRLLVLAAGHPSSAVQSSAEQLEVQLFTAAIQTEWHVSDLLKNRSNDEHLSFARERNEAALATAAELERAVKSAGASQLRAIRRSK